jgi:hypothetical protein
MNINESKVALIGVVFCPNDGTWLVQDGRKALENEFPCVTKADVLDKIAEILDDMSHTPNKLAHGNDGVEVVAVAKPVFAISRMR